MTADSAPRSNIANNSETAAATRSVSHDVSNLSVADDEELGPYNNVPRPAIASKWQTDRPQLTTKASILDTPGLTRRMTNASLLNEASWSKSANNAHATSSSSEDKSEEHNHCGGGRRRNWHGTNDSGQYSKFQVGNDDYETKGRVRRDGRLNISVNETNNRGYLAKALGATFLKSLGPSASHQINGSGHDHHDEKQKPSRPSTETTITSSIPRPTLNIVVMVIGSRGDIQPFLKLGKNLREFGHRVRIATHPAFKDFVQKDSGLEFFSVGGDPAELMAFMVKNPGMIPSMDTLVKGEVGRRRDQMAEMFEGFWRACINATDDENDEANLKMMGAKAPFIADAIIANPPSFAHSQFYLYFSICSGRNPPIK
jgi:Glycosyltransferase family 28 N-terminal domain